MFSPNGLRSCLLDGKRRVAVQVHPQKTGRAAWCSEASALSPKARLLHAPRSLVSPGAFAGSLGDPSGAKDDPPWILQCERVASQTLRASPRPTRPVLGDLAPSYLRALAPQFS